VARVLVIDDDPTIRMVVRRLLEPFGHEVLLGEDGLRGVGMAQRQRPDVVVIDLMMPVVDGYTAIGMLVGDPRTAHVPVIVLSALTGEIEQQRAIDAGAFAVLEKPFEPESLNDAILAATAV
jgi:CheY-like chemotaxis protein